ncbi:hypothetical protein M011DRAFT_450147 [Sporormia fimetaria CBS 119925]|uniref:Zn(2)-C6 fungal-type domain-containing protein n=1 Tax=Sporormia fimetaria CBS 119925 TaxID=1340428 RepID=A0A6A6V436_9PLEO|nr:hypothetical protein M011DRAFT_450147 [Sporormia fimetaria CBS 119925]
MAAAPHPPPDNLKRKRSPSQPPAAPLTKSAKTHNTLQINYLARQCETDLPLITQDASLPSILSLLNEYQGVLDRHESIALNLGCRPVGPILVKRFERLFDAPPRVLKCHAKEGTTVTWLDVVEFARSKPEQFQLAQMADGHRVCQFYTKQCRVQISEEDYVLINSGFPQSMIPPQPIPEDEEKELSTMEMLEKNLTQLSNLADQVAARTRQLNHRLKGRKQAILDRRANASPAPPGRPLSPSNVALMNGSQAGPNIPTLAPSSQSSPGGFVAVNARPQMDHSANGVAPYTRQDLVSKFPTVNDRRSTSQPMDHKSERRLSIGQPPPHSTSVPGVLGTPSPSQDIGPVPRASYSDADLQHLLTAPTVAIPNTPSNLVPPVNQRANHGHLQEKDDGGPFKSEMVHRMEALAKGERVLPPCDRCRRLQMDCLKNLTACQGCTKKHAKCSWREVKESEIHGAYPPPDRPAVHNESEDHATHVPERSKPDSPSAALSPPRHGMPPALNGPPPVSQHAFQHDARPPPHRLSPPPGDQERARTVEAQLQDAAKLQEAATLGLAHAHNRLNSANGTGKAGEYRAMVA